MLREVEGEAEPVTVGPRETASNESFVSRGGDPGDEAIGYLMADRMPR